MAIRNGTTTDVILSKDTHNTAPVPLNVQALGIYELSNRRGEIGFRVLNIPMRSKIS